MEEDRNHCLSLLKNGGGLGNYSKYSNKAMNNISTNLRNYEEEIVEIDRIMMIVKDNEDQIIYYQNENNILKERILTSETELKVKEKELKDIKEIYDDFKKEQDTKNTALNQYVMKSVNLEQNVSNLEIKLKNKEYKLVKEIEELNRTIDENKRILESKEKTIETLNSEIKSYMQIINQKDQKIQDLKNEIKTKEDEIQGLILEKEKQINRNDEISSELNLTKANVHDMTSKLRIKDNELIDFKLKGKNIFSNYEKQIENYKLKIKEHEQTIGLHVEDNRNLNKFIDELKAERQQLENQFFM